MTTASLADALPAFLMPEPDRNPCPAPSPALADAVDESSDEESVRLMLRVRDGDVKAFERLVEMHQGAEIGRAHV